MEINAPQNNKKPQYPTLVKAVAATAVTAAAALAVSSCQVRQQQQPRPVDEALLPGWIISK